MAFHEVRFPDNISRGARGGPERRTQIVELASGDEERNASWANSRRRYDVAYGMGADQHAVIAGKKGADSAGFATVRPLARCTGSISARPSSPPRSQTRSAAHR